MYCCIIVFFIDSYTPINKIYSFVIFSLLINAVILPLKCLDFNTLSLHTFSFLSMLFSLLKHYLELCITGTALKVSRSLCCFTSSVCHGVENYFPRLWGRASVMLFSNSFSHYAPVLWNSFSLQEEIAPLTSFRKHIKTHPFNSSFPT